MQLILAILFLKLFSSHVATQVSSVSTNLEYFGRQMDAVESVFNQFQQKPTKISDTLVSQHWDHLLTLFFNLKKQGLSFEQRLKMVKMELQFRLMFPKFYYEKQTFFALEDTLREFVHFIILESKEGAIGIINNLLPGFETKIQNELADIFNMLPEDQEPDQYVKSKLQRSLKLLQIICENGFEMDPELQVFVYEALNRLDQDYNLTLPYTLFRYKHKKTFEVTNTILSNLKTLKKSKSAPEKILNAVMKHDDFASNQMANELPLSTVRALLECSDFTALRLPLLQYLIKAVERYYAHYYVDTIYNAAQKENARIKLVALWAIVLDEFRTQRPKLEVDDLERLLRVDMMINANSIVAGEASIAGIRSRLWDLFIRRATDALKSGKRTPDIFSFLDKRVEIELEGLAATFTTHRTTPEFQANWETLLKKMEKFTTDNPEFEWSNQTQLKLYTLVEHHKMNQQVHQLFDTPVFERFKFMAGYIFQYTAAETAMHKFLYATKAERKDLAESTKQIIKDLFNYIALLYKHNNFVIQPQYMKFVKKIERDIATSPYLNDILDADNQYVEITRDFKALTYPKKKS